MRLTEYLQLKQGTAHCLKKKTNTNTYLYIYIYKKYICLHLLARDKHLPSSARPLACGGGVGCGPGWVCGLVHQHARGHRGDGHVAALQRLQLLPGGEVLGLVGSLGRWVRGPGGPEAAMGPGFEVQPVWSTGIISVAQRTQN